MLDDAAPPRRGGRREGVAHASAHGGEAFGRHARVVAELQPAVEPQRVVRLLQRQGAEFDYRAGHLRGSDETLHAVEDEPAVGRAPGPIVAGAGLDALAPPPCADAFPLGAAPVVEAQEERLPRLAEAGVPVDERELLDPWKVAGDDRFERAPRPFGPAAAVVEAGRL